MKRNDPRPTMKDAALETGVSPGKVSKVISGSPAGMSCPPGGATREPLGEVEA